MSRCVFPLDFFSLPHLLLNHHLLFLLLFSVHSQSLLTLSSLCFPSPQIGILFLFLQHTSAALSLNENCDPTVRTDMDMALDTVVPESLPWEHVDEGPDDSVSHTKSSIIGVSVQIPVTNGRLALGTWQGAF
jgi:secondary thiamine-phosphate synthase enzyme